MNKIIAFLRNQLFCSISFIGIWSNIAKVYGLWLYAEKCKWLVIVL